MTARGRQGARVSDAELMQHADGELDPADSARLRALLDDAPDGDEARAKLEGLAQLGELVRGHLELTADEVPARRFEDMWRAIDGASGGAIGGAGDAPAARGWWGRVWAWFDRHRGHVFTGAVCAGAVAALALVLRPSAPEAPASAGAASTIDVRPVALRSAPAVDSLDTPDGTGTVLNLEDEDGHTIVIWVTPADTVEGI